MPNFELTLHLIDVQTRVVINNQTDAEHIFRGLPILPPSKMKDDSGAHGKHADQKQIKQP